MRALPTMLVACCLLAAVAGRATATPIGTLTLDNPSFTQSYSADPGAFFGYYETYEFSLLTPADFYGRAVVEVNRPASDGTLLFNLYDSASFLLQASTQAAGDPDQTILSLTYAALGAGDYIAELYLDFVDIGNPTVRGSLDVSLGITPVPTALVLLGTGLAGLAGLGMRRKGPAQREPGVRVRSSGS